MAVDISHFESCLSQCKSGDILVCRGPLLKLTFGKFKFQLYPEVWAHHRYTHSGLFDKEAFLNGEEYCILSSSGKVKEFQCKFKNPLGAVGYESIRQWANEDEIIILRASDYDAVKGYHVINYAKSMIGKPFGFSNLFDPSSFYCSKLVYLAWKSQNVHFEFKHLPLISQILIFLPNHAVDSQSLNPIFKLLKNRI